MGYYRNCVLANELAKDDTDGIEYKDEAWKKTEHRGDKESKILD